jgi:hypothetical protein
MAEARVPAVLAGLAEAIEVLLELDGEVLAEGETHLGVLAQLSRLELVACRSAVAFEASAEWRDDGAQNGRCWVTAKRRARRDGPRRRVTLGNAIQHMPRVEAAWAAGEIDPAHVEVLAAARTTTVAAAFGRDEADLVAAAKTRMFHKFQATVEYWLQHAAPDETEARAESQREQRRVHLSPSFAGMWFGTVTLDPIGGDIVNTELRRLEQGLFTQEWAKLKAELGRDPRDRELRTPAQRRADALVEMATRSRTAPAGGRRPAPLFSVVIDYETLAGRVCELASQQPVTPGSLVPWLDDAYIERVVFDGKGRLLDVGVRRRLFRGALRRGIQVRDRECGHPLCDQPVEHCEVDHIERYADGGDTTDANARLACGYHNRLGNTRPWPNPPTPDHHTETDPVSTNEQADEDDNEDVADD